MWPENSLFNPIVRSLFDKCFRQPLLPISPQPPHTHTPPCVLPTLCMVSYQAYTLSYCLGWFSSALTETPIPGCLFVPHLLSLLVWKQATAIVRLLPGGPILPTLITLLQPIQHFLLIPPLNFLIGSLHLPRLCFPRAPQVFSFPKMFKKTERHRKDP